MSHFIIFCLPSGNLQLLQTEIMLRRQILLRGALQAFTNFHFTHSFIYSFSYFNKKDKDRPLAKSQPINTSPIIDMPQQMPQSAKVQDQFSQIRKTLIIALAKKKQYELRERQSLRKLLKDFNYLQLNDSSLQNLQIIAQLYLFARDEGIIVSNPKSEFIMYEAFTKIIDKKILNNVGWKEVAKVYMYLSKMNIIYPGLHSKVPISLNKILKKSENWKFEKIILLNILDGLTCRQVLLKDEKTSVIFILSFFHKRYQQLSNDEKIELFIKAIQLNSHDRFGLQIVSEEKIISFFLKDLEGGKISIKEQQYARLVDNDYPSNHPFVQPINQIIIRQSLELLDAKGQIKNQQFKASQMLEIIVGNSRRHTINKLSQIQKIKLLHFLKRELQSQYSKEMQQNLASMLNNNFFVDNYHILPVLIKNSKIMFMTIRLAFELTRTGLNIDQKHFIKIQSFEPRRMKLQTAKHMHMDELLILVTAHMQLQINPKCEYYKVVCDRYITYLKGAVEENYQQLITQIVKLPQIAVKQMHKWPYIEPIYQLIQQKEISKKYAVRNNYVYLLIKYTNVGKAEQSKWYESANIDELLDEILITQLKMSPSSRYYSTSLLVFLNSYMQKVIGKHPTYYQFVNIKKTFYYLQDLGRAISDGRISYQSHIYLIYWQTINYFLRSIDAINADVQWKLHFSQFLDILLISRRSHFFNTHEYRSFIRDLLPFLPKLKPHYEIIARIINCAIYRGIITEQNCKPHVELIKVDLDLYGEPRDIVQMWLMGKERQQRHESMHKLPKFVNPAKVYASHEVVQLKEEISEYDVDSLIKILQLYRLPITQSSREIYKSLIFQIKKRDFGSLLNINFIAVLTNVYKYLYFGCSETSGFVMDILNRHFKRLNEFTIQYQLEIIAHSAKQECFHREYQRLLLATAFRGSINPFIPIATVRCLAKTGFGFNSKELRAIEEAIKASKTNWLEVFLLLQNQFLPELLNELLNHILHHQTVFMPATLQTNNKLVHNYLYKKYPNIYDNSYFASLKQKKSYRKQPIHSALISQNLLSAMIFLASIRSIKFEQSSIISNSFVQWDDTRVFFVEKASNLQLQLLRRLFSNLQECEITCFIIGLSWQPEEAIASINKELGLELTETQKEHVLKLLKGIKG